MKKNSVSEIKIRDNMLKKTLQLSISICYHDKKLIKNDKKSFMLILIYIMKIFHSNNFNKYLNKFI